MSTLDRSTNGPRVRRGKTSGDVAIARVVAYLKGRAVEPLRLDQLAGLAAMSRSHFSRRFRAVTGRAPGGYLRDLRMRRARDLLLRRRLTLTQVAVEAGFYDLPHFDKAFRKRFGVSPSQFVMTASAGPEADRGTRRTPRGPDPTSTAAAPR